MFYLLPFVLGPIIGCICGMLMSNIRVRHGLLLGVVPGPVMLVPTLTIAIISWVNTGTNDMTTAAHIIGKGDFGRIQRLCAHLDDLLSRASKAGHQRKRNMHRAADRLRLRIRNLVEELHHKAARYLVDNYDVILIPRFESSDMVRRRARRLRRKSVRNLLTFAHYRFRSFLQWKAEQMGKTVLVVNEAYTSKTCSWSGEIIGNLGGRKVVQGSDGIRLDRDINGARGIFLRALGDTPLLKFGLSRCNTPSGSVTSGLTTTQMLTDAVSVC